jgi:predicted O-linked N-acetylglucosamine transferase (SPINDLY family)
LISPSILPSITLASADDDGGKNEASPYPGPESGLSWDDYVRSVEIFNAGQRQHASRPQQAKRLYVEAVAINPFLAEAYLNLGIVSDTQEEVQEAYLNAARAAGDGRNDPVYTDALANLGHFLVEDSGRGHDYHVVEQAIAYYTQALRVTPEHQTTLYNLGIAYEVQGKRQEAYDTYRKVLAANQLHVGANLNSGNLLMYAGLFNLSLAFHERALRGYAELGGHDPWWQVGLLNNMGQTMIAQNDAVAALSYYREALALVEDEPMTLFNIFKARRSMCDWEGWSDTQVPRMIAMTTDDLYGSAAASSENKRVQKLGKRRQKKVVIPRQDDGGDSNGDGDGESKAKTTTMMPYDATLLPVSRRVILDVAIANVQSLLGLAPVQRPASEVARDAMLGPPPPPPAATARQQDQEEEQGGERQQPATSHAPLKIAYYGYDFNNHPMGHLTCGMFERHSRARVSVLCTPYGADDETAQRSRIIRACDYFENTTMLSDFGVASKIATLGAHIAVDLMAHTTGTRIGIPAYHPGDILVNYLGYPGTIGAFADYIMVDRYCVPPETAKHDVSEKVAYLPHHYQANDFLPTVDLFAFEDRRKMLSTTPAARRRDPVVRARNADVVRSLAGLPPRTRGNPARGVVLCNFNTIVKVEPVMFKTWLDILQRSPPSTVLWLLRPKGPVGDTVVRNLLREAAARGVLTSRLVMAPRVKKFAHLDRLRNCDLFLDTFDYTAHSTASDVLFAGVPVLTVQGQTFASRVATTLVQNAGIDEELVVHSKRDFTDQAVWLARHPRALLHLRRRLAHHIFWYPLFDTGRLTRNVERSYQAMWDVRQATGSLAVKEGVKRVTHWRPLHLIVAPRKPVIGDPSTDVSTQLDAWVKQAVALQTAGTPDDLLRASNIYRRVLAGVPNHADSWHLLGLTRNAQGHPQFGAHCLEEAVRLMPSVAMYRSNLIELQRAAGRPLDAIENIDVLIRDHPDYELPLDTVRALIDELRRQDERAHALELFMRHQNVIFESVRRGVVSAGVGANVAAVTEVLVSASFCAFELGEDLAARIAAAAAAAAEEDKPMVRLGEQVVRNPRVLFDVAEQILSKGSALAPSNARMLMKLAVMIDHSNRFDESLAVYVRAFDAQHVERYAPDVRAALGVETARARARQRVDPLFRGVVVIFCDEYGQTWWPNWGPTSMDQGGAGGSEEAVIFISAELVKLGYHVEVYGEPLEEQWGVYAPTGVWWLPLHSYDQTSAPDVFVSWRYHISMFAGDPRPPAPDVAQTQTQTQRYLWLQDISSRFRDQYTPSFVSALHGIFVLSEFHASQGLPEYSKRITHITPNALDEKYFVDGRNENHHFIYASAPNRGLREVLLAWPGIRAGIKRAMPGVEPRLEVYYGFSPSFLKYGKSMMGDSFEPWLAEMKQMLRQDGVAYFGMVDHRTLATAYARAGFYLYPTSFPETGCVALMKAQALGAVPITSRNPNSTLPELTRGWDLGPPARTDGVTIDMDPEWQDAWADAVVRAAVSGEEVNTHRAGMVREARQRFLWSTVAKQWAAVFAEGGGENGASPPLTMREVFGTAA